jgi:hypothetical protein
MPHDPHFHDCPNVMANSLEEYRELANFCLRAAGGSADKETWLRVAEGWMLLARAAEDSLFPDEAEAATPMPVQPNA